MHKSCHRCLIINSFEKNHLDLGLQINALNLKLNELNHENGKSIGLLGLLENKIQDLIE